MTYHLVLEAFGFAMLLYWIALGLEWLVLRFLGRRRSARPQNRDFRG